MEGGRGEGTEWENWEGGRDREEREREYKYGSLEIRTGNLHLNKWAP